MSIQKCGLNINTAQKELQPHGTIEFPCAAYQSCHTNALSDAIPWHWHEEVEIIYVRSGNLKLQIPGKEYLLYEGELIAINSNILHYVIGAPFGELQSMVFSILLLTGGNTTAFYKKYIHPLIRFSDFDVWKADSAVCNAAFQNAYSALAEEVFAYEFTVREGISKIMLCCFEKLKPQIDVQGAEKSIDTLRIEKMLEYIQNNYANSVSLRDITRIVNLSERECLRCFNRMLGDTPMQYLLKYRLMKSASLLCSMPSASIAEISSACGFDHPSYYSKQFKRFYQCTPRQYREQEFVRR